MQACQMVQLRFCLGIGGQLCADLSLALAALLCLANLERSNIINVIEGVRYGLSPEQISAFLKY